MSETSRMRPKKIILITVDTLRADHLGCYGYNKATSPNIDRLAGEGVLYRYAFSPCPYTVPTHTSFLTGLYPINHSVGFKLRKGRIDTDSTVFLQEVLQGEGYATGAFVSTLVLGKQWGFDCGFDVYDDNMTGTEANREDQFIRNGRETTKAALEWIAKNKGGDLFAWLHYFDVHGAYAPVPGLPGPFVPDDYGDSQVLLDRVPDGLPGGIPEYQLLDVKRGADGEVLNYQRDVRHYLAGYDNGVKFQDIVVGELLDGLRREGVYDESMIVLTADHGEAMGEYGVYFFHGLTVTPEQTRVPLIIKPPAGFEKGAGCGSPVSTVDIMPTILEHVGFPRERLELDGTSLIGPEPDRFVLSENEWQRAVIWREFYLLQEKDVVYDGFCYYFDSQDLCRGDSLIDYKGGATLPMEKDGPAGPLLEHAGWLKRVVDPKERRLKEKDRVIAERDKTIQDLDMAMARKDGLISQKDNAIAEKDHAISVMDQEINSRGEALRRLQEDIANFQGRLAEKERELDSVYGSKSWKLTYPIRWISARLKGTK